MNRTMTCSLAALLAASCVTAESESWPELEPLAPSPGPGDDAALAEVEYETSCPNVDWPPCGPGTFYTAGAWEAHAGECVRPCSVNDPCQGMWPSLTTKCCLGWGFCVEDAESCLGGGPEGP